MEALLAWIGLEPRCHYGRYGCVGGDRWARSVLDIDDSAMSLEHPGPARGGCPAEANHYNHQGADWYEQPQVAAWLRKVHGDPNRKYAERFASDTLGEIDDNSGVERHEALAAELGQRVYEVSGYRLLDYDRHTARTGPSRGGMGEGPEEWWRGWCGQKEVRF